MIIRLENNIKISAYIIYRLKNTANPFKIGIDGGLCFRHTNFGKCVLWHLALDRPSRQYGRGFGFNF